MRSRWISFIGCLVLVAGQAVVRGQEVVPGVGVEPTPVAEALVVPVLAAQELQLVPEVSETSALGFRTVSPNGEFVDAERTTVRVVKGGRVVHTGHVGESGVVQISKVVASSYTVFASGIDGIAAYGIYLGDPSGTQFNRVGLVPTRDATLVRELIGTHRQGGATLTPTTIPENVDRFSEENSDFEIAADGSVYGQAIHPAPVNQPRMPIANLYVAFIQGRQVIAETHTDAEGYFSMTGVASGIYSLAVSGPQGFAAYSVAVIQPEPQAQARVQRLQFVALHAGGGRSLVCVASPSDLPLFNQVSGDSFDANPAGTTLGSGGGGFGGGAGGGTSGGGSGGGEGLLSGLLGAGAGAALGAALGGSGNGNGPATPAIP